MYLSDMQWGKICLMLHEYFKKEITSFPKIYTLFSVKPNTKKTQT